jgi:hypothetical protein
MALAFRPANVLLHVLLLHIRHVADRARVEARFLIDAQSASCPTSTQTATMSRRVFLEQGMMTVVSTAEYANAIFSSCSFSYASKT